MHVRQMLARDLHMCWIKLYISIILNILFIYIFIYSKEMKSEADTVAFSILGAFLLQEKVLNAHFIIWFSDFEWRATELSKFNKNDWNIKVDNDFSSQNYVDLSL